MKQNSRINMIPIETLLNIVTYDFLKLMRNRNKEGKHPTNIGDYCLEYFLK